MAKSVDENFKEIYNLGLTEHNKNKEAKKQTAESDKQIVNTNADTSIKSITDGYNTQIADTEESYENAFQRNELQVKLNERYLERKAAEMGLTDSGMNRTQMTANQLSYANQKGELTHQRQKAVDTLAAAMRSKITEVDTNRNNQIAQIDSTLNNDLAQMDLDYASDARQRATDTYNAEYKAEKELEAERIKAEKDAAEKATKVQQTEFSSLWKVLKDENDNRSSDSDYKLRLIDEYVLKYDIDIDGIHMAMLLNAAGLSLDDYRNYVDGAPDISLFVSNDKQPDNKMSFKQFLSYSDGRPPIAKVFK